MSGENGVVWPDNMVTTLISMWSEDRIRAILDGRSKRCSVAYQEMADRFTNDHGFVVTKSQVNSKIKYLRNQFTKAKNADRSGAGRDDLLRVCPYYDQLIVILDHSK